MIARKKSNFSHKSQCAVKYQASECIINDDFWETPNCRCENCANCTCYDPDKHKPLTREPTRRKLEQ